MKNLILVITSLFLFNTIAIAQSSNPQYKGKYSCTVSSGFQSIQKTGDFTSSSFGFPGFPSIAFAGFSFPITLPADAMGQQAPRNLFVMVNNTAYGTPSLPLTHLPITNANISIVDTDNFASASSSTGGQIAGGNTQLLSYATINLKPGQSHSLSISAALSPSTINISANCSLTLNTITGVSRIIAATKAAGR
jgi:hypothetical protein